MKKILCAILVLALTSMSMGMGVYQNDLSEVNVTSYGATGNGVTDDTASIQKAIDSGASKVIIPDGTYMINALISVKPRSNQSIQLSDNAILKAIPNSEAGYSVIKIADVTNVEITGGTILGERYEHTGTTGEWGFGILISGGTDTITITNLTVKNCWGDGIYIGSATTPAKNLRFDGVVSDSNRRQGMSITFAENVIITNCTFKNTNGTNPQAGIDIEPNPKCYVENVAISSSAFLNNKGSGIFVTDSGALYVKNAKISNCVFVNNHDDLYVEKSVIDSGYAKPIDSITQASLLSTSAPSVTYQSQIQDIGWQGYVSNGSLSGTNGQSKRLEAINIKLENLASGIEYKAQVQDIGWMDWTADGAISGTVGQSKRLEAIQIRLTGAAADKYDIYYRAYVQNIGWMDWSKNGEQAGTVGSSSRMEGIQILLVNK